jgi:DNA-binding Lrp family transcriptional regulator
MDALDRRLLDRLQAGIPLLPRPFAAAAAALAVSEEDVVNRLVGLRAEGVLRQVSAIFDTRTLGYRSALVAATAARDRIEAAARAINAHPGVSHNYERDSDWNLWFTLAVPPDSRLGLEGTAARLADEAGCARHRLLPALRVFKIGVRLDMEDGVDGPRREATDLWAPAGDRPQALSETGRLAVRLLQEPFPLVAEPFAVLAMASGLSVDELLAEARGLERSGALRRVAALLHHRRAGFAANVMGVWAVPEARAEEVGQTIAGFRAVSHCYQRPTCPDWPYSLFSMVHGRSREECLEVLEAIALATGVEARAALWTLREFKKVRLRLFTPEYAEWERPRSNRDRAA